MYNMVTKSNRISCISMHWATTTNQPSQTEKKKKTSFTMASKTSRAHYQKSQTFCAGVTADLDPPRMWTPPSPSPRSQIWTPSTKRSFLASFVSYLVTNSICKLSVDVLFNHNTTFLNKGREKQPFRSNSATFIIASRTVYARIRCEQITAFELLKLLQ